MKVCSLASGIEEPTGPEAIAPDLDRAAIEGLDTLRQSGAGTLSRPISRALRTENIPVTGHAYLHAIVSQVSTAVREFADGISALLSR